MSMHHLGPYHDSEHYGGIPARPYERIHGGETYERLPEENTVEFVPWDVDVLQDELG